MHAMLPAVVVPFAGWVVLGLAASTLTYQPKGNEVDTLRAVRKAAEKEEVHVVGVGSPVVDQIPLQDMTDWPGLVTSLRLKKGAAARVRDYFSEDARARCDEEGIVEKFTAPKTDGKAQSDAGRLMMGVLNALNKALDDRDFYQRKAFDGVDVDEITQSLIALGSKRTSHQSAVMNWRLLHAAFPKSIPKVDPRFRTIRVQVKSDAPVVLVLSCYNDCRWEVSVKPGCKVVGVVLCGNHAQEFEAFENPIDIPTVYRARYKPDGSQRLGAGDEYFDGYDKLHKKWPKFAAGVKDVTGKDVGQWASFQGKNTPDLQDEPYIIPPRQK